MRLIDADAAIDALCKECSGKCIPCDSFPCGEVEALQKLQTAQPEIIRCKDCRWWEMRDDTFGYCHAAKHGHWSEHWDIRIWRVYRGDFYCADAELRLEEEGEDETN